MYFWPLARALMGTLCSHWASLTRVAINAENSFSRTALAPERIKAGVVEGHFCSQEPCISTPAIRPVAERAAARRRHTTPTTLHFRAAPDLQRLRLETSSPTTSSWEETPALR